STWPNNKPMDKLLRGIVDFSKTGAKNYLEWIKKANSAGGAHSLIITCVDSRVCPTSFTQCGPGSFFMVKTPGNFVPTLDEITSDTAGFHDCTLATMDLTFNALGIKNAVVCGHSDCKVNVLQQLCTIRRYPFMHDARLKIQLFGLWIDLDLAQVHMFSPQQQRFIPVTNDNLDSLIRQPSL
ncbi:hypothetical protein Ciccas_014134, partial [Cichlidogyrus casuarinus]